MAKSSLTQAADIAVINPAFDYLIGFGIRCGYDCTEKLTDILVDVAEHCPDELRPGISVDDMTELTGFLVNADKLVCMVELSKLAEENGNMYALLFDLVDRHRGKLRLPAYRLAAACSVLVRCGPALAGV